MSGRRPHGPRPADLHMPPECRDMICHGALVAVNSSGGKDSQAMTILLARTVPRDQLVVVHAPLGEVEWPGTIEHIENTIPAGVPLIFARVASGKSLLERVEERGMFPSPTMRFCTSDMKVSPIERELRRYLKAHPRFEGRLVSAMGLRRDESAARAKRIPWKRSDRNSRAGREWFDWLPVFDLTVDDVFRVIREAGQSPHWVYAQGMARCSCSFCIFASSSAMRRAAELRPGLYRKYTEIEKRIGHTLSPSGIPLPDLTGIPADPVAETLDLSGRLLAEERAGRMNHANRAPSPHEHRPEAEPSSGPGGGTRLERAAAPTNPHTRRTP